LRLRDEDLLAVEHPLAGLAIEGGGGADVGGIGAGSRLGDRNRDRQILPFLVLLGSGDRFEHGVAEAPSRAMERDAAAVDLVNHERMEDSRAAPAFDSIFG